MAQKDSLNVLVLGSGGREHALAAGLAAAPSVAAVWVAPGNGGTAGVARNVALDIQDGQEVAAFARAHDVDLVVIGPEAPLVAGVADVLRQAGIAVFGPGEAGARMEGSKAFAKEVMEAAGVPTARYQAFDDEQAALAYLDEVGAPVVVKADGLAAGKGVVVAQTLEEAQDAVRACFSGTFGDAGSTVVVEEMLAGPEVSLLSVTDGRCVVPLATAQDHKRAWDGDQGPNTGGMGAYSPVPLVTDDELAAMARINERVVQTLAERGIPYQGVLYGGFMLTAEGPKVLEFNARFGDPETQVILPRLRGDLGQVLWAAATQGLDPAMVGWDDGWAVSVVLASEGYPGSYQTGRPITGIEEAEALEGVNVYHAGTRLDEKGQLVTSGGRVLNVCAVAPTFEAARDQAYAACDLIQFEGKAMRRDIGLKAMGGRGSWQM